MNALARLAVGRPKHVLAVWLVAVSVLAFIGLHIEGHLHQKADLVIPGTAFARADDLATERFGRSVTFAVMFKGPPSAIDRQGPGLAATLERQPGLTVLSPWQLRDQRALWPKPNAAVLIVRTSSTFEKAATTVVPGVRKLLEQRTRPPLEYHLTGNADVSQGIHQASVKAVQHAEILAAPLLMLVLLLVFRSPVAASLPLVIGGCTIGASRGVLDVINRSYHLDALALNLCAMMGLALGVDYALLMVSRFREELREGRAPPAAALASVSTAGRTVVFAGIAVMCAMAAALFGTPGGLLISSTIGIIVAVVISVVAALTALPATLVLVGPRVNLWTIGRSRGADSRFGLLALRALRRPALASALVLALIALIAAPAVALDMGPPTPLVMPSSQTQRVDYETFTKTLGPGWTSPYQVIVAARHGPITDRRDLAALARFQRRLSARRDVDTVLGPAEIAQGTRRVGSVRDQLAQAGGELHGAIDDQTRLKGGLSSAAGGVDDLTQGLASASAGAKQLQSGGGQAAHGAELLANGISRARAGAERMRAGLASAGHGAKALAAGARRARSGIGQLHGGLVEARDKERAGSPQVARLANALDGGGRDLGRLREPARLANDQLASALQSLDKMLPTGKRDPQYKSLYAAVATAKGAISGRNPVDGTRVQDGYDGLDSALAEASRQSGAAAGAVRKLGGELGRLEAGLARLANGASKAATGTGRLQGGLDKLVTGLDRLGGGGADLTGGLARLEGAGQQLASGTRRLQGGAGALGQGLSSGAGRTGQLRAGLGRMEQGVASGTAKTKRLAGGLGNTNQLGDVAQSGYFSLAAIDAGSARTRGTASFALNLDRGGSAVRFVIFGKGRVEREGHPLRPVLMREAANLARETGADARVGGDAVRLQDYERVTSSRLLLLAILLSVVTYVVLVPVLRSVLLPLLAITLTALTVVAALGVLVLLFQGSAPLGGAGFMDAIVMFGVYSIAFALSVDYEVFLLARMREGWTLFGSTDDAVAYGLRKTAGVVTGAAMSMTGVFAAFALTDLTLLRQLGVGLTVAVLLDATLIRLVLLPAAMRLLGDRCWWLPRPLGRLLTRQPGRLPTPPAPAPAPAPAPSPLAASSSR